MYKVILTLISLTSLIIAQQFERVNDGPVGNDGGDSRAVNWVDYDNDGDLDLYITNGPQAGQNNFMYENNGDGSFTKVTSGVIVGDNSASDGTSWGDIDNDGDLDLYVANWWGQSNLLYTNNGDKSFTPARSSVVNAPNSYSETASWGDYNNDGYLDLYVNNSEGTRRNQLFTNDGNSNFTEVTTGDMVTDAHYSRDVDWIDINNDGYQDLYVANEFGENNALYFNNGDGSFTKNTSLSITADGKNSWSTNWIDYDNDGDFDLFITNWEGEDNSLYQNNGDGSFTAITEGDLVSDGGFSAGADWGDIDNDGDLDVYVANAFADRAVKNFFYLNNGDGTFTKVDNELTIASGWTYGVSFGDYDRDGYLDLAMAKCLGATENNALFRNLGGSGGDAKSWVVIKPEGSSEADGLSSNRSAIGAVVRVQATINGEVVVQSRRIEGQNGYCGQNLEAHFGLGDAQIIDEVVIEWPDGNVEQFDDLQINTVHTLKQNVVSSIGSAQSVVQDDYKLFANYPNPFNPSTTINYSIPESGSVRIAVYDMLGNEVAELVNNELSAGSHQTVWNGENGYGSQVSSGIYFYTLTSGSVRLTKKMMLLK